MGEKYSFLFLSPRAIIAPFGGFSFRKAYGRLVTKRQFWFIFLIHFRTCFNRAMRYLELCLTFFLLFFPLALLACVSNEVTCGCIGIIYFLTGMHLYGF